jgi:electron transport complex protein RnfD
MASFPAEMSAFPPPFAWAGAADATAAATPLSALKEGLRQGLSMSGAGFPAAADGQPDWGGLLLGAGGGCLGEASVAALAAGALFLGLVRVINWEIPLGFLGALGLLTGACWLADPGHFANPLFHLLSGGALLGACFMATDPVTSPMSRAGRLVYALGGGLLCALFRLFGAYPEGCSFAILLMNATVPLIDRGFHPRRYGHGRPGRRGEATP